MNRFGTLSFAEAIGLIEIRLCEAASTLRLMPRERHDIPDAHGSAWPNIVRSAFESYGYEGDPGFNIPGEPGYKEGERIIPEDTEEQKRRRWDRLNRRVIPSPDEITRMDQAVNWLLEVANGDRAIVMARAQGRSWRWLEDRDGRSDRAVRKAHESALEGILGVLMEEG